MGVKVFKSVYDSNEPSLQEVPLDSLGLIQKPILFLAPGFLAQRLDNPQNLLNIDPLKPINFALRTAKEMISQSGDFLNEELEILCLTWPSATQCREELNTLLRDPLFVGKPAQEFSEILPTLLDKKITFLTFSYGGAFVQQIGSYAYEKNYSLNNCSILSIGHSVGVTAHELFGFKGLHTIGNNDRVANKASQFSCRNESLKPSLEHKVHWFDNNKGVYTFPVPI